MGRPPIRGSTKIPDTFNLSLREGYRGKLEKLAEAKGVSQTEILHQGIDAQASPHEPTGAANHDGSAPLVLTNYRLMDFSDVIQEARHLYLILRDPAPFWHLHRHGLAILFRQTSPNNDTHVLLLNSNDPHFEAIRAEFLAPPPSERYRLKGFSRFPVVRLYQDFRVASFEWKLPTPHFLLATENEVIIAYLANDTAALHFRKAEDDGWSYFRQYSALVNKTQTNTIVNRIKDSPVE